MALGKHHTPMPTGGASTPSVQFARVEPIGSPAVEIVVNDVVVRVTGDIEPDHLTSILRTVRIATMEQIQRPRHRRHHRRSLNAERERVSSGCCRLTQQRLSG